MNLEMLGNILTQNIKNADWFPFKSGNLKFHATNGHMYRDNSTYVITFSSEIAPYVEYLEEGTSPHDIPRAFGYPLPFGIGGRFNGKFHPGSNKHKGFIKDKAVNYVIDYIRKRYDGVLVK